MNPLETLSGYEPHTSYEEHARRIRERLVAERLSKIVMKGEVK